MEWQSVLSLLLGFLGTGGIFISSVMFRKVTKRSKVAEAFSKEVDSLRETIGELRKQISFCEERLLQMQSMLSLRDNYIDTLSREKNTLEIKNARNKSAINKAYECAHCGDVAKCAVLMQRSKNEEEYLKVIEHKTEV